jgi:hypothetical protein
MMPFINLHIDSSIGNMAQLSLVDRLKAYFHTEDNSVMSADGNDFDMKITNSNVIFILDKKQAREFMKTVHNKKKKSIVMTKVQ